MLRQHFLPTVENDSKSLIHFSCHHFYFQSFCIPWQIESISVSSFDRYLRFPPNLFPVTFFNDGITSCESWKGHLLQTVLKAGTQKDQERTLEQVGCSQCFRNSEKNKKSQILKGCRKAISKKIARRYNYKVITGCLFWRYSAFITTKQFRQNFDILKIQQNKVVVFSCADSRKINLFQKSRIKNFESLWNNCVR